MSLTTGTRLGPYEILSALGAGGMGEVYRARDTRLDRTVAIKVLPEHLSNNPQLRERFDREAKAISSLSHPHICPLYDVGHQGGVDFLVMEYLEGETLAHRLKKGPLAPEQVLQYALQITDALDTAHKHAVIHRDLKPGNIMLVKNGAKLLDFGLAKVRVAEAATGMTALPTQTTPLTVEGTILGTLQYMAPEQLEGKEADARTDIFALGAVIYEMATGRKAFEGKSQASLISAIMTAEPPLISTFQSMAPLALDHVVRTCLAKEPDERRQAAHDVLVDLKWIAQAKAEGPAPQARMPVLLGWLTAAALFVTLTLLLLLTPWRGRPLSPGDVARFAVYPPEGTVFTAANATVPVPQFAISPDGRAIVFAAAAAGARPMLWLRSIEEVTARPLPGTEDAVGPFWSPDRRWVGFCAEGKLKKIPAAGGAVQVMEEGVPAPFFGGTWGRDDTILSAHGYNVIYRVASAGGPVTSVTKLDAARAELAHRWPQFLPDDRHFLFTVRGGTQPGVFAGSLDGKTKKFLVPIDSSALYTPPGYLLWLDGDTLLGQAFDLDRLELSGQPFTVAERVGRSSASEVAVSVSAAGTLAYAGAILRPGRLTWFDRSGNSLDSVGAQGDYPDFRLSPDDKRLAASLVDPKTNNVDIWLIDLGRSSSSRFTFGPALNASSVWSPDGARLVFRTLRKGVVEFYQKSAFGGGNEEPVLSFEAQRAAGMQPVNLVPADWSPDGRHIIYSVLERAAGYDLWLFPLAADAKPVRLLVSASDAMHGNFSRDGKFVAYSSNESGRFQVYVQTFPLSDRKWPVSTNGGYEPRWRGDGREIYYLSEDRKLMAVSIGAGPSFGVPKPLFQTRVPAGVNALRTHYVPTHDGQRFLINTQSGDPVPNPITVVLNWTAGLKK